MVRLNSAGAAKMASGNYEDGATAFAYGLAITATSSSRRVVHRTKKVLPSGWNLACTQAFLDDDPMKLCHVFDRCFIVSTTTETNGRGMITLAGENERLLLSAILSYNLALAFHLAGCQGTENQRYNFCQARAFNKRTLRMVQTMSRSENVTKLSLATLNNMASLALEELDFKSFHTCRKQISSLTAAMESDFYFDFFVGNFVVSQAIHEHPASSA